MGASWVVCTACGLKHTSREDGTCPRCGQRHSAPAPAAPAGRSASATLPADAAHARATRPSPGEATSRNWPGAVLHGGLGLSWLGFALRLPPGKLQASVATLGLLDVVLGVALLIGAGAVRPLEAVRGLLLAVVAVALNVYAALQPHGQSGPVLVLGMMALASAIGGVQLARRPSERWLWALIMFVPMLPLRLALELGVRQWGAF